jgi:pantoate kinase
LNLGKLDDETTKEIASLIKRPAIQDAMRVAKAYAQKYGGTAEDYLAMMTGC